MVTIEPDRRGSDAGTDGAGGDAVAEVAAALAPRRTEVSASISDVLATRIDELRGDPGLRDLLGASVEGNVETILHVLRHDLDPRGVEPPAAAVAYARRLAQREVPVNALIRAYRVGQAHLMEWAFAEAARRPGAAAAAASQRIVLVVMEYVDHVTQQVVAAYEAERDRGRRSRHALRVARVRDVLAGRTPAGPDDRLAVESTLGYRFSAVHLGLVVSSPSAEAPFGALERVALDLGTALDAAGRPLVVPWDGDSAWAWLPCRDDTTPSRAVVEAVLARHAPGLRVAAGAPMAGVEGFRTTHDQARRAHDVALAVEVDPPRVTLFDEVGAVALLCADRDGAWAWTRRVLGPLADPDPAVARLRETLRTFLATGGSLAATARRLRVHRNTVKYRVARAHEVRGRPLGGDRLDVELALMACAWLGPPADAGP
ncbi:PucR family transcriptional regulator [Actinomycetospora cinnamomea]|uniref:DNA-binding PucR family transcriptional regulator n=1 Tax=Actinomycetospora cinnamomea TaxID=663609 RepID=A0A2U1F6Z3_9PSEU|nr:helix-turn-helix domain-containing protein [Actinomycetospora cinnamomea]PVZ07953.1 DNA-binding PucR family transcriptional regulator [Actinomycetospora cinnamomea]